MNWYNDTAKLEKVNKGLEQLIYELWSCKCKSISCSLEGVSIEIYDPEEDSNGYGDCHIDIEGIGNFTNTEILYDNKLLEYQVAISTNTKMN